MSIHRFHPRFPYPPIINDYRGVQTVPLCCGFRGGSVLTLSCLAVIHLPRNRNPPLFPVYYNGRYSLTDPLMVYARSIQTVQAPIRDGIHLCHPPKNSKQSARQGWRGRKSAVSAAFCTLILLMLDFPDKKLRATGTKGTTSGTIFTLPVSPGDEEI